MKYEYFLIPLFVFGILGMAMDSLGLIFLSLFMIPLMFLYKFVVNNLENGKTSESVKEIYKKKQISKYYIGKDNLSSIGLNESLNEIVLLSRNNIKDDFESLTYSFEDLFEVKLIEDEETVISANRLSQLGGALVGGAAFGAVGAIVGGSGGKQHSQKEVRKINLELVFDSIDNPLFSVSFMNEDLFMKSYDPKYKEHFAEANKWYKSFTVILKRNELNRNH